MDSGRLQGRTERSEGVYFVQDEGGPVKVGIARDPIARVSSLQSGNPRGLTLLAWFVAPAGTEKRLHWELEPFRVRGEWFENVPEVMAVLDRCVERFGVPECEECDRHRRYVMAGHEPPPERGPHMCGSGMVLRGEAAA